MVELWNEALILQRVLGATDNDRRALEWRAFLNAAKDTPIDPEDTLFHAKQAEFDTAAKLRGCGVGFGAAVLSRGVMGMASTGFLTRRIRGLDVAVPLVSMGLTVMLWMIPESIETTASLLSLPASPTAAAARQRIRDTLPDSIIADVLERRAGARMPVAPSLSRALLRASQELMSGKGGGDSGDNESIR